MVIDKKLPTPGFHFTGFYSILRNENGEKLIGKYRITRTELGRGTYGTVKLCQNMDSGEYFSAKVYSAVCLYRKREFHTGPESKLKVTSGLDKAYKEVELMQDLVLEEKREDEHDNEDRHRFVQLHDVLVVDYAGQGNENNRNSKNGTNHPSGGSFLGSLSTTKLYMIVDYLAIGSLMIPKEGRIWNYEKPSLELTQSSLHYVSHDVIHPVFANTYPTYYSLLWNFEGHASSFDWGTLNLFPVVVSTYPEALAKCFIRDGILALRYLHSRHVAVAHRDVKPDNLLLDELGRVKLGDFGVAGRLDGNGNVFGTEGTYLFMPPECMQTENSSGDHQEGAIGYHGHDGRAADIWSVGVTLFCLLFGEVPFYAPSMEKLFGLISEGKFVRPVAYDRLSVDGRDFLERILRKDPTRRPTAGELLEHPWLHADYNIAHQFAQAVLKHRGGEGEIPTS